MSVQEAGSLLEEALRIFAVGGAPAAGLLRPPTHVDVRLTAPLTLEDVQTLNAWLQEPKPVDVSHVVIDPKQVSVGSQRDWNDLRCASTPRGTDLRSDLNTAVAKLQPRRLGFEASR